MGERLIFDIETDGLLFDATRVHVLVLQEAGSGEVETYLEDRIEDGLRRLKAAKEIVGHNIIAFDLPVLERLYGFRPERERVTDTLVLSRLLWPDIGTLRDFKLVPHTLPNKLWGRHSLEAWGYRLGILKVGADISDWSEVTKDMIERCRVDVRITAALLGHVREALEGNPMPVAVELEHRVAWFCAQIERNGFKLDVAGLEALAARLMTRRAEITQELQAVFPPKAIKRWSEKTGKRLKDHIETFNPGSRQQIVERLKERYGWQPVDFTDNGNPKVDETVLGRLPYSEAKLLSEYYQVNKILGYIAEGENAWLKLVRPTGFVHGAINPNGAITGRATHHAPNVAQVPSSRAPYGKECRSCWTVPEGWVLLGVDAKGLELRGLAHFLYPWDGGLYVRVVTTGDPHTHNQQIMGLETRDQAKTEIYALIYGAGDRKLGEVVEPGVPESRQKAIGRSIRMRVIRNLSGFERLVEAVALRMDGFVPVGRSRPPGVRPGDPNVRRTRDGTWWLRRGKKGALKGLDGRELRPRSKRAAINTLIQSAGALVCKRWLVEFEDLIAAAGLRMGWDGDVAVCAWIHDELQIAVREGYEKLVGDLAQKAARRAGEYFRFRCPIEADTPKVGKSWAETH